MGEKPLHRFCFAVTILIVLCWLCLSGSLDAKSPDNSVKSNSTEIVFRGYPYCRETSKFASKDFLLGSQFVTSATVFQAGGYRKQYQFFPVEFSSLQSLFGRDGDTTGTIVQQVKSMPVGAYQDHHTADSVEEGIVLRFADVTVCIVICPVCCGLDPIPSLVAGVENPPIPNVAVQDSPRALAIARSLHDYIRNAGANAKPRGK